MSKLLVLGTGWVSQSFLYERINPEHYRRYFYAFDDLAGPKGHCPTGLTFRTMKETPNAAAKVSFSVTAKCWSPVLVKLPALVKLVPEKPLSTFLFNVPRSVQIVYESLDMFAALCDYCQKGNNMARDSKGMLKKAFCRSCRSDLSKFFVCQTCKSDTRYIDELGAPSGMCKGCYSVRHL